MNRFITGIAIVTLFIAITMVPAQAQELDADRFYGGGGIGHNELNGDDALGYQVFAGYHFAPRGSDVMPAIEIGYWDSGDLDVNTPAGRRSADATGLWATGVVAFPLADRMRLLGRAGYDFGDDDGLMAGGGLGYDLNERVTLRGEIVARDNIDSLQFNALYWF